MSGKKEIKLQLRFYPEKDELHRRALAWLMERKADGASYADLVSRAICSLINHQQNDAADERMRQVVRDEIRNSLRTVTVAAPSAAVAPAEPPKPTEGSLRKAKGFMSSMGFG